VIKRTTQATASTRILSAINQITIEKAANMAEEHLAIVQNTARNNHSVQDTYERIHYE